MTEVKPRLFKQWQFVVSALGNGGTNVQTNKQTKKNKGSITIWIMKRRRERIRGKTLSVMTSRYEFGSWINSWKFTSFSVSFGAKNYRKRREDHASLSWKKTGNWKKQTKKMCKCSIERGLASNLIVVDFDILKSNSLKNTLVKDRKDGIYFTGKWGSYTL